MQYIKYDKSGKIEKILENKPKWYLEDGSLVTDEWLIENENMYPVIDIEPNEKNIWGIEKKEPVDWIKHDKYIEVTYWIIKDELPEYDSFDQYLELKNRKDWKTIDPYIFRTYDIKTFDINDIKNDLTNYARDIRVNVLLSGIYYKINNIDVEFNIDNETRMILLQYYLFLDEKESVDWKLKDGSFIMLTKQQIFDIMNSITLFIKQCFDNENRLVNLIKNANNTIDVKNIFKNEFDKGWDNKTSILFSKDDGDKP